MWMFFMVAQVFHYGFISQPFAAQCLYSITQSENMIGSEIAVTVDSFQQCFISTFLYY